MQIQQQIMQELAEIPEDKLSALYDFIYYFKLGLINEKKQERKPGILQGTVSESFFEPLPDEELNAWE
ncbi:MAG: hypothetical protein HQK79_23215 [Desulfobacterales bacterium]|nr:hypothetical protein [Desulfobacterales bacterium]